MSQVQLCKFWCLLDGDEKVFSAEAGLEWDVDQLAKAIRQEKRYLRQLDASEMVLLKLNEPIPVDPEETLLQRLSTSKAITDYSVKLRRTEQVSDAFPNSSCPKKHLQIIVKLDDTIKRRRPDSPFDIVGNSKKRQKELPRLSDQVLQLMKELYEGIYMLSEEPTKYSDPNEVFDLPFPSVNQIPPCFSLLDESKISFMGRECFSQVWKTFGIVKNNPHHRQAICLFGGNGLGKSHILAALACLLLRKGTQVVYLPDCHEWLFDPLRYLRDALVFAFLHSELSLREEILGCGNLESLANFCANYQNQLCFIVDQVNALDLDPKGQDVLLDTKKDLLRQLLHRMCAKHILISSASANYVTFRRMAKRDTGEEKVFLMEGMTSAEMACWWKYHGFTAFSDEEKQKVEDLTGCIPLLLNPFVMHHEKTLESLEPEIWMDEALQCVLRETFDFASAKKSELDDRTYHDLMRNCLLGREIGGSRTHLDYRYFYLDTDGCVRYYCGLARQAITELLRQNGEERIFLGNEWHKTLEHLKNNPSAIGFTVEQILISKMASAGLNGSIVLPRAKIITFEGETTWLSVDEPSAYYVPLKFSKKPIDVLFVSVDRQAQTARLVAIQIAVAKQHSDSEAAFFAELNTWLLGLEGFKVDMSFLWIHEGKRGRSVVEKKLKELRGRTVVISPNHVTHWMSVEQVDVEIARTLTRIRSNT